MKRFPGATTRAPLGQALRLQLAIYARDDLPGDKLLLPSAFFKMLNDKNTPFPFTFKVTPAAGATAAATFAYAGVLEFSADQGCVFAPTWMLVHLGLEPGASVFVASHRVPRAEYACHNFSHSHCH